MGATNPLGQDTNYPSRYDPSLIFSLARDKYRADIKNPCSQGEDIWNCYEFSWINSGGKPEVAILQLIIPATSKSIVESKSLKLYLGSFANERFQDLSTVLAAIKKDLTKELENNEIKITAAASHDWNKICVITKPQGDCIDSLIQECDYPRYDPEILVNLELEQRANTLIYSDLFRSLCPVTNQPDWATVIIEAEGGSWNYKSVLDYLISFRNKPSFHEHCCETIFSDLKEAFKPDFLTVQCKFTRRGGIDINPIRTSNATRRDSILKLSSDKLKNYSRLPRQ